jgi:hypothetical protein
MELVKLMNKEVVNIIYCVKLEINADLPRMRFKPSLRL